jgi:NADH-quinone oxidoreductase subunit L
MAAGGFLQLPFLLAFAGFAAATYIYLLHPLLAPKLKQRFSWLAWVLEEKYGFDILWMRGFAGAGIAFGNFFARRGDGGLIDGLLINGSANLIQRIASILRKLQSGYLYDYAFAMILGLIALLAVLIRTGAY